MSIYRQPHTRYGRQGWTTQTFPRAKGILRKMTDRNESTEFMEILKCLRFSLFRAWIVLTKAERSATSHGLLLTQQRKPNISFCPIKMLLLQEMSTGGADFLASTSLLCATDSARIDSSISWQSPAVAN